MYYEHASCSSELQTHALAVIRKRLVPVILVTGNCKFTEHNTVEK